jgi:hypothetical protein
MAARFQQTFYTEKSGAIGVTIDDSSFSSANSPSGFNGLADCLAGRR